jgi:hypothetical protein
MAGRGDGSREEFFNFQEVQMATADDPFDLDALRENPLEGFDLEAVTTTVPVRRPGRSEFFRVHPEAEFTVDAHVIEHVDGLERTTYWLSPQVRPDLNVELAEELRPVRLHTCISKRSVVFLWPARLPTAGSNSGRAWHQSALEVAEQAKTLWVKMVGNKDLGAYEYVKARGDLGEPQWPEKSFRELLDIAFRERIITTMDHPVVRDLLGTI